MLRKVFVALNVRPDEEHQVSLLLLQGFFVGVFLASYQVGAETLFLNSYSEDLEIAYVISGALGVLTTALFSLFQGRVKFSRLSVSNLLLIALYSLLVFGGYKYLPAEFQEAIIFLIFAMVGPITAVILLGFWGVFGRLFDLRQSKRIIGWIDSGQLIAAILTFFLIPIFQDAIGATENLLLGSGISMLIAAIFLFALIQKYPLKYGQAEEQSKEVRKATRITRIFRSRYVKVLSAFLLLSMLSFIIIQYSFQDAISKQYPDEAELRNFISFFEAFILIFMLLLQTFVNDRILSQYGIKVALFILPVVSIIFISLSIFTGYYFGFTPENSGFIYFFLAVALTRLFSKSFRDALENPTFKLYFMPLDNRFRFNIQTKIEGIVNEFSRFSGSLIILGLSSLTFFAVESIHLMILALVIGVGYIWLIGKLYSEYRNQIKVKLEDYNSSQSIESNEQKVINRLQESIYDQSSHRVIFSFKLLEKINPALISSNVNKIMSHHALEVRDYAQGRLNEIKGLSVSEKYVASYADQNNDLRGKYVLSRSELEDMFNYSGISTKRILKLSRSVNPDDRLYATELIINSSNDETISILIEMLSDNNFNVRNSAIKAAQQKNNPEVIYALIKNLDVSNYANQATDALIVIGNKALNTLDSAFYQSGQSTNIMIKVIQIIGKIGGGKARGILWNKIEYPQKIISSQVLIALGHSGFKAGLSQITHVKYAIESDIEDIAWNLAAISEVSPEYFGEEIIQALKEENILDVEHIYMLLRMLYEHKSIQLVKDNIETGTNEGISFAVELLDVFVSEDLKQRIIPVLDDMPEAEKFKKLEAFYPRQKFDNKTVLKLLVNREFNQTNHWTKACVIYQLALMKDEFYLYDLIANLFNPDPLLHEISAWALYYINPDYYFENVKRLPEEKHKKLDFLIIEGNEHLMKFNKIRFMKQVKMFEDVPGMTLYELADMSIDVELDEGQSILLTETNNYNFYLVYKGSATVIESKEVLYELNEGSFVGEVFSKHSRIGNNYIRANQYTLFLKFYKDTFYDYLADHIDLMEKVVEEV